LFLPAGEPATHDRSERGFCCQNRSIAQMFVESPTSLRFSPVASADRYSNDVPTSFPETSKVWQPLLRLAPAA